MEERLRSEVRGEERMERGRGGVCNDVRDEERGAVKRDCRNGERAYVRGGVRSDVGDEGDQGDDGVERIDERIEDVDIKSLGSFSGDAIVFRVLVDR